MSYQIKHFSLALLNNFRCDIADLYVDFGDGVRLVHNDLLPKFESDPENIKILEIAKNAEFRYKTTTSDLAATSHYALIYQFEGEVKKAFHEYHGKSNYLFNNVITSLRLAKPGFVGRLDLMNRISGFPNRLSIPSTTRMSDDYLYMGCMPDAPYRLSEDDVYKIKEIFMAINQRMDSMDTRSRIALDRFNYQYARESELDRLIDIIVAFEALYGEQHELKFRISIRGAKHLGESDCKIQQRIYDCLSDAYDIRSEIVHGSKADISQCKKFKNSKRQWRSPGCMLEELSTRLRKALYSILLDKRISRSKQDFCGKLDKAIISGSAVNWNG